MFVWFSFVCFSRWNWWWAPRDEAQPSTVTVTLGLTKRKCFVVHRHEPSGTRTRVLGLRWRFRHAAHARFPLINKTTAKDMTSIPSGRNLHHQAICCVARRATKPEKDSLGFQNMSTTAQKESPRGTMKETKTMTFSILWTDEKSIQSNVLWDTQHFKCSYYFNEYLTIFSLKLSDLILQKYGCMSCKQNWSYS